MPAVLSAPAAPVAPERRNDGWLAAIERRLLLWLAARLPAWLTPDRLTAIGFAGAILAAAGYALSARQPGYLWLASFGLAVNWFGDSLDGSVARWRRIERPRYGFFLDQSVDALEQLLFCLGLGLSGYVRFELAMTGLAVYFMMSILTLLGAIVTKVFTLARGGIGLTELRFLFIAVNGLMFFSPPKRFALAGQSLGYPDLLALAWIAGTIATYVLTMVKELRALAQDEPALQPPTGAVSPDRTDRRSVALSDHS